MRSAALPSETASRNTGQKPASLQPQTDVEDRYGSGDEDHDTRNDDELFLAVPQDKDPLQWGARALVDPKSYLQPAHDLYDRGGRVQERKQRLIRLQEYVRSPQYQDRLAKIKEANLTGIVIPAGGVRYLANTVVTLKVSLFYTFSVKIRLSYTKLH